MRHRHPVFFAVSITLLVTLLISAWPPAALAAQTSRASDQVAANDTGGQIYLPFVTGSPSAPSFTIVNPLAGSTVAGTIIFAIRVDRPDTVTSRNFKAGSKDLGAGVATANGFQVYVDARQLPAGPATFTRYC